MRRTLLTAALASAGALAFAAPAAAAPPPPSTYQGAPIEEGYSRSEQFDDHGVYLHSIDKGKQYFSYTDDSMLEDDGYSYYGTRASTFYLNTGCTADGSVTLRKVGKGAFFQRIDSTSDEAYFTAEYDAAKDSGTFTLLTAAPGAYDQERERPDVCTP